MPLNEQQKEKLSTIVESGVFKAAKEEVLVSVDSVIDLSMSADAIALRLAYEKGVRAAFSLLVSMSKRKEPMPLPKTNQIRYNTRTR